jgi:hypothetical protein
MCTLLLGEPGGTTSLPADGVLRPAKIQRVEFEKGPEATGPTRIV